MHRVHGTRGKPTAGAELHATDRSERDRSDGQHCPQEIHSDRIAVETEYVRGGHDPTIAISRCQVTIHSLPPRINL